jgi:hypothetical protein
LKTVSRLELENEGFAIQSLTNLAILSSIFVLSIIKQFEKKEKMIEGMEKDFHKKKNILKHEMIEKFH